MSRLHKRVKVGDLVRYAEPKAGWRGGWRHCRIEHLGWKRIRLRDLGTGRLVRTTRDAFDRWARTA